MFNTAKPDPTENKTLLELRNEMISRASTSWIQQGLRIPIAPLGELLKSPDAIRMQKIDRDCAIFEKYAHTYSQRHFPHPIFWLSARKSDEDDFKRHFQVTIFPDAEKLEFQSAIYRHSDKYVGKQHYSAAIPTGSSFFEVLLMYGGADDIFFQVPEDPDLLRKIQESKDGSFDEWHCVQREVHLEKDDRQLCMEWNFRSKKFCFVSDRQTMKGSGLRVIGKQVQFSQHVLLREEFEDKLSVLESICEPAETGTASGAQTERGPRYLVSIKVYYYQPSGEAVVGLNPAVEAPALEPSSLTADS